jgi:hypothetical protein
MNAGDRDARIDADFAAPLRDAAPALDELHRARLAGAIEAALDLEDQAAPARRRARRTALLGGLVASLAVAAVAGLLWRHPGSPMTPAAPAPQPTLARAVPRTTPLLVPYRRAGDETPRNDASTSLVAMRGERTRATISNEAGAQSVRLTLVGPGRLSVLPTASPGEIELALDGGRLLADYDRHAGGTLRLRSPGAVTTVVGTAFAVDVTPFGTRVGVAHGRVRTEDATGRVWQVDMGTAWSSAGGHVRPLPADLAAAIAEHEAAWATPLAAPPAVDAPEQKPRAQHRAAGGSSFSGMDLEAIYAQAEEAMRRHAADEARRALQNVAARDPDGPLGQVALLDLARLALAEGDQAEARRLLARLPASLRDPALAETADHLRCRAASGLAADAGNRCR